MEQRKYGYVEGSQECADRDLVVLSGPRFPILDYLALSPNLLTVKDILDCRVDEDEDYLKFRADKGFESSLDHRRLGLIIEVSPDPNTLSSSTAPSPYVLVSGHLASLIASSNGPVLRPTIA